MGFLALTMGLLVVMVAAGYAPTKALAGSDAILPMVVGCLTSVIASWAGAVPIMLTRRKNRSSVATSATEAPVTSAIMLSIVIRFAVVAMVALSVAIGSGMDKAPYLIWVAISYMLLLVIDTMFTLDSGPLKWRRAHA